MATGGPGQQASSPSSPDWNKKPHVLSPASPSHLTHFKPLTPELDEPPLRSAYSSFVNLFRFSNRGRELTHTLAFSQHKMQSRLESGAVRVILLCYGWK